MTNEEITEEIYHDAFERGFVDQLNEAIGILRVTEPRMDQHDRVYKAYHDVTKNMGIETVNVT